MAGGSLTAAQLYAPYGGVRYSNGSLPTLRAFTGQYADAMSGLSYYHARYYDPVAGQFTSADAVKGGQGPNRYAYVLGNPTTRTDPTGQRRDCSQGDCSGGGDGGSGGGGSGSGSSGGSGNAPNPIETLGTFNLAGIGIWASHTGFTHSRAKAWLKFFNSDAWGWEEYTNKAGNLVYNIFKTGDNWGSPAATASLEGDARAAAQAGRFLLGAAAIFDGVVSGFDYYGKHADAGVGAAILYGTAHAVVTTAAAYAGAAVGAAVGAWAGAAAGAAIGQAIIPIPVVGAAVGAAVGEAIGSGIGEAVGGFVGGFVAGNIMNNIFGG